MNIFEGARRIMKLIMGIMLIAGICFAYDEVRLDAATPSTQASEIDYAEIAKKHGGVVQDEFAEFKEVKPSNDNKPFNSDEYMTKNGIESPLTLESRVIAAARVMGITVISIFLFWVFCWVVGWIVRGFVGIPMRQDRKT